MSTQLQINEKTAAEAFEQVQPELARIKPDDYQPIRVDLLGVITRAIKVADQAANDRPLFEETFQAFPMQDITKLKTYALALLLRSVPNGRLIPSPLQVPCQCS